MSLKQAYGNLIQYRVDKYLFLNYKVFACSVCLLQNFSLQSFSSVNRSTINYFEHHLFLVN